MFILLRVQDVVEDTKRAPVSLSVIFLGKVSICDYFPNGFERADFAEKALSQFAAVAQQYHTLSILYVDTFEIRLAFIGVGDTHFRVDAAAGNERVIRIEHAHKFNGLRAGKGHGVVPQTPACVVHLDAVDFG